MRNPIVSISAGLALAIGVCTAQAQTLTGQVTSAEEGAMEGVLVSAKKTGSTITVTVVSDAAGRYAFPAGKLDPGPVPAVRIRAIGYDLDRPATAEIAAQQPANLDIKLRKTEDLAAQMSNGEWLASFPGTDQQKNAMLGCVGCHTVERIARSTHTADEFINITLPRMQGYVNQSIPAHPQLRKGERRMEERGDQRVQVYRSAADFLSSINLSSGPQWKYQLKTLPRPKGRATHVIITEYDLPRKTVEPHDVALDAQGNAWYSTSASRPWACSIRRPARTTEFNVPILKPGFPTGELGMEQDPSGNFWFGMMFQGGVAKLDPKTDEFQTWNAPADLQPRETQINMAAPQHSTVDGKVWTQNNGFAVIHRIDLATGKIETFQPFKDTKEGENHNIYDVIPDSHNNAYFTDFANEQIGRVDAKTGEIKLYNIPTKGAAPRRGQIDAQDRVWFGEYKGNKVGMFDPKTEKFTEWMAPTAFSAPYDVQVDKNGDAWTGSMTTDRVLRLDPKSGQFTEYMLPRSTNIRRVYVDNTTTPPSFWVGNNHGASIVKVEPLD